MKPLKDKISITIDSDILEKIKLEAENDDRSLSQYINIILKDHIKNIESTKKDWPVGQSFFIKTYGETYQ